MKRILPVWLVLCLLLSGCGMFSDSYVSITPHRDSSAGTESKVVSASNYLQLRAALVDLIHSGAESGVIHVRDYRVELLDQGLQDAVEYVLEYDAIGAYAVESIHYEQGVSGLMPAVAVSVEYTHSRSDLQKIQTIRDSDALWRKVETALQRCDSSIVVLVEKYTEQDLEQMIEDYAAQNPATVIEIPQISCQLYPDKGASRVVELKLTYQNSRSDLRQMQSLVKPIFESAALYVSGSSDYQKASRLYSFLMERFGEYQIKTSITPSYSLLHHGVGDSRAFATVYAQMCRMADLECRVVAGTRKGEPWSWNMVKTDDSFFHVDLLDCYGDKGFRLLTDEEMTEYVWDYSAYPACEGTLEAEN